MQADIDKIFKIIQRKVLKGMHLPVTVKQVQAGYLISPYSQSETLGERYTAGFFIIQTDNYSRKRNNTISNTRIMFQ